MSTEKALLAAVWEHPHDDTPRLVYADWLEETGDPANVARAEFIRLQCELARLGEDDPRRPELEKREGRLWKAHGRTWRAGLPSPLKVGKFRRGFPHPNEQHATGRKFLAFPAERLAAAPLWTFNLDRVTADMIPAIADGPTLARTEQLLVWEPITGITPADIGRLAGSANVRHLTALGLGYQPVGDGGVRAFAAVADLPHLTDLYLSRTGLTDAGVRVLSRWAGAERLRELMLDGNDLTDAALAEIARGPLGRGLETLLIGENPRVTTDGLRALLASPVADSLRLLNLNGLAAVTDTLVVELAANPRFGRLEALVLHGTRVGERGVLALVGSPHLTRLRYLNLFDTRVKPDGKAAAELRSRFPGCYF